MKINSENTIIEFQSTPENFDAEYLGIFVGGSKRNTTRFFNVRENMAITHAKYKDTLKFIRIVNAESGESFMRKLTDFRVYMGAGVAPGYYCWIWSW